MNKTQLSVSLTGHGVWSQVEGTVLNKGENTENLVPKLR